VAKQQTTRRPRIPATPANDSATTRLDRRRTLPRRLQQLTILVVVLLLSSLASTVTALGSTVSSATFSGGAGTVSVGGTLYAKNGGALTLTVSASSDTKCVAVTGAFTDRQTSSTAKSTWTFTFTAPAGDGIQTVTAAASPSFNANNCTGQSQSLQSASYILDNTGPVVTGALSPAANGAGWNNSNVSITWSATDAGSGVASGPTPATDSQTQNTAGVTKTATASDRLGNVGNGSLTVKLDKTAPSINGSRSPAPNAAGWNNTDVTVSFTCTDTLSGIKLCTGGGSVIVSTEGANQSVPGTAIDNADNTNNLAVTGINIDKTAPSLSGAPTTSPNVLGWYKTNVAIAWTCSDALSGLNGSCPSNSTISSEGTGLTASASVTDKAGNSTNATSSPAVKIDKTAPTTVATAPAPANWNNVDVTVDLAASDGLSGVANTSYTIDGGGQQTYSPATKPTFATDGIHTLQYWSVDNAGNEESHKSIQVKIDKTSPEINHTQSPLATAGWNNTNVTVTFMCADATSGIASCTAPQTVTTEGAGQVVTGTATDNAGNTASDPASVSIDKTPPTISAAADRDANGNGWYDADVSVSFTCGDALSGIASCSAPQSLGEGADQSATGAATDAAGNDASASVSGINVDETPPLLSGAATSVPNGNGWYHGDVTIQWAASDALSGLDGTAPADSTITGEGDDLSASASVSDLAGNSTSESVSGIKIDRTPPSTLVSVPAPLDSGWYADDVEVTLTPGADLSGVDKTYFSVDGGSAQEYSGPFNHSLKGSHTITFWSVDNASNLEDKAAPGNSITLKIDGVPPTLTGSRLPLANAFGWNNSPVAVTFNCFDAESGIAGCDPGVTLANEGPGQSYTGLATDNAGNTNTATVSDVSIDLTAPTLSGAATTSPNAYNWYNGNVSIHWTAADGLSGIDPATTPADSLVTGEGANLGASASVYDKAGNPGNGSVVGLKIDRTNPTISGATVYDNLAPRSPNTAGWFNSAVRVHFTCGDALSGVQECATDDVLSADGAGQSSSGTVKDKADNLASATVSGINIDSLAPTTDADLVCSKKNGFCRGNKATVVLDALDQAGLSGVKEIRYSVNGGATTTAAGNHTSVEIPLNGSGVANVAFQAMDNAGNLEPTGGVEIHYDTIAPTVTHVLTPAANADGWNKANVTVHFNAVDDALGSGVDTPTITPDVLVSVETAALLVNGSADDLAGNTGTDSVTVKLDKTPPTISGAPTTSANANGWYNAAVTVHYTCADSGGVQSGIATCSADDAISVNGSNLSSNGTAEDKAGNTASATVSGINIDTVKPVVTVLGIVNGDTYTLGNVPTGSCGASDLLSGVDGSCSFSVTGGNGNGVGTFNFTATAKDKAGNVQTVTGSYKVGYRWDGFLQPINDTAHQVDQNVSVFKAGSTVPVKFQLKRADGTAVQAASLPQWLTPAKGSPTTSPVDETLYSDAATNGTTYRWDSTAQQYIYNWGTAKNQANYYWRIGVALDDGNTYWINTGLR
jgi:hypothetical protein